MLVSGWYFLAIWETNMAPVKILGTKAHPECMPGRSKPGSRPSWFLSAWLHEVHRGSGRSPACCAQGRLCETRAYSPYGETLLLCQNRVKNKCTEFNLLFSHVVEDAQNTAPWRTSTQPLCMILIKHAAKPLHLIWTNCPRMALNGQNRNYYLLKTVNVWITDYSEMSHASSCLQTPFKAKQRTF